MCFSCLVRGNNLLFFILIKRATSQRVCQELLTSPTKRGTVEIESILVKTWIHQRGVIQILPLLLLAGFAATTFLIAGIATNPDSLADIRSLAAAPKDKESCGGCVGNGYEWKWKSGACKKVQSAACKTSNKAPSETCPGTCTTEACTSLGLVNSSGNCNKDRHCCAKRAATATPKPAANATLTKSATTPSASCYSSCASISNEIVRQSCVDKCVSLGAPTPTKRITVTPTKPIVNTSGGVGSCAQPNGAILGGGYYCCNNVVKLGGCSVTSTSTPTPTRKATLTPTRGPTPAGGYLGQNSRCFTTVGSVYNCSRCQYGSRSGIDGSGASGTFCNLAPTKTPIPTQKLILTPTRGPTPAGGYLGPNSRCFTNLGSILKCDRCQYGYSTSTAIGGGTFCKPGPIQSPTPTRKLSPTPTLVSGSFLPTPTPKGGADLTPGAACRGAFSTTSNTNLDCSECPYGSSLYIPGGYRCKPVPTPVSVGPGAECSLGFGPLSSGTCSRCQFGYTKTPPYKCLGPTPTRKPTSTPRPTATPYPTAVLPTPTPKGGADLQIGDACRGYLSSESNTNFDCNECPWGSTLYVFGGGYKCNPAPTPIQIGPGADCIPGTTCNKCQYGSTGIQPYKCLGPTPSRAPTAIPTTPTPKPILEAGTICDPLASTGPTNCRYCRYGASGGVCLSREGAAEYCQTHWCSAGLAP
jgi:hypothetical protein